MALDISKFRFHRSPPQERHEHKDSESWGSFIRYVELGDDGYAIRQVDEYKNGYLSRYDREHWDDQFGTLADMRFGDKWVQHWGVPSSITRQEFEEKWTKAGESSAAALKNASPQASPPWLRSR
jgi:hypothetical protein